MTPPATAAKARRDPVAVPTRRASTPRRTPVVAPARPRLQVVRPPRPAARRAPFVVVVITLLVGGLASLLAVNTFLAQGSFRLHDLQAQAAALADQEQALQQEVAELAAPARLAARATSMGMVPVTTPAFLRTSDGRVLGRAVPAGTVVPQWATGWQPPPPPAPPEPSHDTRDQKSDAGSASQQDGPSTKAGDKEDR